MARGKIVCFYGGKGGVGKTTTLLSLAGTLSKLNKKVLIVDLDLTNGAIAISLNREANKTIFNFVEDYINNKYNDLDKYITKYDENISFVASPKDPRYASRIDVKYIDILLEKSVYNHDVVLIDTPSILNEISVYSLDKSDVVYLLTTNDCVSLKNIKNIVNLFIENNLDKYKIILNNSFIPNKDYFSNYDIKNIIGHNVDYVISSSFHVNNLDELVVNGEIITYKYSKFKDEKIFKLIANEIIGGNKDE
ncbi:MAG: AAA family ATPase [Tenericutes bacterium]|nr:AAA family ATPase [Mycoplasmatota bacterium]